MPHTCVALGVNGEGEPCGREKVQTASHAMVLVICTFCTNTFSGGKKFFLRLERPRAIFPFSRFLLLCLRNLLQHRDVAE